MDHRSFFSLGQYVNEFIQIISFFEKSSFKLRCESVTGIVLCYSQQACYFLQYLREITCSGIHIYLSDLNTIIGGLTDLAKTRHGSADLHTPIHPPPDSNRLLYIKESQDWLSIFG